MMQVSQSKGVRGGRVVRPFVYSAIGSLECVTQHSLGSFNHKLYLASKTRGRIKSKKTQDTTKEPTKENRVDRNLVTDTENHPGVVGSTIGTSNEHLATIDTKPVKPKDECDNNNVDLDQKSSGMDIQKSTSCFKRNEGGKKRVTINGKSKEVRPVELFRPSCDAYTPRTGRRKIK